MFCLVETWHDVDSVSMRRLRLQGFVVIDRPRPRLRTDSVSTNHGGVAIIVTSTIRSSSVSLGIDPCTFEHVCARLSFPSGSSLLVVIYRTGPVSSEFFRELNQLLDLVVAESAHVTVAGDFNIHLERENDPHAQHLKDAFASHCLSCHVTSPTHDLGGLLDLVFTNAALHSPVRITDPGLSDLRLISWSLPISKPMSSYISSTQRPWSRLCVRDFRLLLAESPLCQSQSWSELDSHNLATLFDDVLSGSLDRLIPFRTTIEASPSTV